GRRHWRILSAAAAAVIVVGGGAAVGSVALGGATGEDSGASAPAPDYSDPITSEHRGQDPKAAAPDAGPSFKVVQSGTDYRAADLGTQIGDLLDAPQPQ